PAPSTLSLHDALPICAADDQSVSVVGAARGGQVEEEVKAPATQSHRAEPRTPATWRFSTQSKRGAGFGGRWRKRSGSTRIRALADRKSTRLNSSHVEI